MRRGGTIAILAVAGLLAAPPAQGQLRVVSYNTAGGPRGGIESILEAIGSDSVGGLARPIDVLALQEQTTLASTTAQIVNLLNAVYGPGTYARGTTEGVTSGAGRPGLIYNTQTVSLISEQAFGTVGTTAQARQGLLYRLRPVGYGAEADFYLFNDHFKSGTSSTDKSRRLSEVQAIRGLADALGDGAHVIYAGDYNVQSASETSIQALIAPGPGQAFDPLGLTIVGGTPVTWNENSFVRGAHTQSPVDATLPGTSGLITGGMDDRFDFQFVTAELLDGEGLSYLAPGVGDSLASAASYRAFGNNGTHPLNAAVNHPLNTAEPAAVLAALASASDHLPVVVDYQLPALLEVSPVAAPSRVLVGATASATLTVTNAAPAQVSWGADELDYQVAGSGSVTGMLSGTETALGPGFELSLPLVTETVGAQSGMLTVTTTSQQAAASPVMRPLSFDVLAHAHGSFAANHDLNAASLDLGGFFLGSGTPALSLDIFNLAALPGFTAGLRLVGAAGVGDTQTLSLGALPGLVPAGASATFEALLATDALGEFAATWELFLADEDLPGATELAGLTVELTGRVTITGDFDFDADVDDDDIDLLRDQFGAGGGLYDLDGSGLVGPDDLESLLVDVLDTRLGDVDLDGTVGPRDLALLAAESGTNSGWAGGNLNGDAVVDALDFQLLSAHYGFTRAGAASVPEPGTASLGLAGLLALGAVRGARGAVRRGAPGAAGARRQSILRHAPSLFERRA